MNFIININPSRTIGKIHNLSVSVDSPLPRQVLHQGAELHHIEQRRLPGTDDDFVAVIYKLPKDQQ